MGKHFLIRLDIDVFEFDSPLEAARDMAYWLYDEGGATRAVYEVIDQETGFHQMIDLEEVGYDS